LFDLGLIECQPLAGGRTDNQAVDGFARIMPDQAAQRCGVDPVIPKRGDKRQPHAAWRRKFGGH
jgi:hypothetical protein